MSIVSDQNMQRVLDAALILFSRHGFKRVSMAEIAREAGVARATLYLRFSDKRAVFEALASSVVDAALAGAAAAWREAGTFADNLEATILAKDLEFFRLMRTAPHGAELFDVDAELAQAETRRLDAGFGALLVRRAEDAAQKGADMSAFGGATEFAAFLAVTASGVKYETRTEDDYRAAIRRLARVTSAAAGLSSPLGDET